MTLTRYSENEVQPPHEHAEPRLSFLLTGELTETIGARPFNILGCSVGYKPTGALHGDRWGRSGALVLTLRIREAALIPRSTQAGWSPVSDRRALKKIMRLLFGAGDKTLIDDALADLVALLPDGPPAPRLEPRWLSQARDEIREQPDAASVASVAASVGVHRTHFSRAFRHHYGVSPSEFRQQVRTARAVAGLTRPGAPLSAIAADAGFFDQAHMSRAIKRATTVAPLTLRKAFADATSVQATAARSV